MKIKFVKKFFMFCFYFFVFNYSVSPLLATSVINSCQDPSHSSFGDKRSFFENLSNGLKEADCSKIRKNFQNGSNDFVDNFEKDIKIGFFQRILHTWFQDLLALTHSRQILKTKDIDFSGLLRQCKSDEILKFAKEDSSCGEEGVNNIKSIFSLDIDGVVKAFYDALKDDNVIDDLEREKIIKMLNEGSAPSVAVLGKNQSRQLEEKIAHKGYLKESRQQLDFELHNSPIDSLVADSNIDAFIDMMNNEKEFNEKKYDIAVDKFKVKCENVRDNFVKVCKQMKRGLSGNNERINFTTNEEKYALDHLQKISRDSKYSESNYLKYSCLKKLESVKRNEEDVDFLFSQYTDKKYDYVMYDEENPYEGLKERYKTYYGLNDQKRLERLIASLREGRSLSDSLDSLGNVGYMRALNNGGYHMQNASMYSPTNSGQGNFSGNGAEPFLGGNNRVPFERQVARNNNYPTQNKGNSGGGRGPTFIGGGEILPGRSPGGAPTNVLNNGMFSQQNGVFPTTNVIGGGRRMMPPGGGTDQSGESRNIKEINNELINAKEELKTYLDQNKKDEERLRRIRKVKGEKIEAERNEIKERQENTQKVIEALNARIKVLETEKKESSKVRSKGASGQGSTIESQTKPDVSRGGSGGGGTMGAGSGFSDGGKRDNSKPVFVELKPFSLNLTPYEIGKVEMSCITENKPSKKFECEYNKIVSDFNEKKTNRQKLKGVEPIEYRMETAGVLIRYEVVFDGKKKIIVKKIINLKKKEAPKEEKKVNIDVPKEEESTKSSRRYRSSDLDSELKLKLKLK